MCFHNVLHMIQPCPRRLFLPPATKLRQGNVFTPAVSQHALGRWGVCIPACTGQGGVSQHALGRGRCVCPGGWLPGVCVCVADPHPLDKRQTPPPPAQCMLEYTHPLHSACWDKVNKQAVRIPLECILVLCMCVNKTPFVNNHKLYATVNMPLLCHEVMKQCVLSFGTQMAKWKMI